jgi:hypothetical protein
MKTSILYGYTKSPHRTILPGEAAHATEAQRRHLNAPVFQTRNTLQPEYGATISLPNFTFKCRRGLVVGWNDRELGHCTAKVIPPEFVETLHELDQRIQELQAQRREALQAAWLRGRLLTKDDCKPSAKSA